jgi:tetratricopeptide (TPR) repeat protein
MAKKTNKAEDNIIAVEEALSKTEQFIENNQKTLISVLVIIVAIVLGFMGYNKLYLQPKEKEARSQMYMAEMFFAQDSLDKALYGDGGFNPGFIEIADDYGVTKSAKLANYYAGICFLKKGEFDNAINHLKNYTTDDLIIAPMALGAIGDAYAELKNFDKAASYYIDAANKSANELTSPTFLFKAGLAYEITKDFGKAYKAYTKIKEDFKNSAEGRDIEKYIAKAKRLNNK